MYVSEAEEFYQTVFVYNILVSIFCMRTFLTFGILAALLLVVTATTAISLNIKLALALGVPCSNCGASILSPGKEAQNSETGQNAKAFAPGQEAKSPGDAQNLAPGQEKTITK
jgi:hypothetical protein